MPEDPLQKPQFDLGAPTDAFFVTPQATPAATVLVSAGAVILSDNETLQPFAGGSSAALPALGGGEASRWDLLSVDLTGGVPVLQVDAGTPAGVLQDWQDSVPVVPTGRMPLAAIHVTEVGPAPVVINETDIEDVRGYYHTIKDDAGGLGFAPTTPADWLSVPSEVAESLDELASRMNSGAAPPDIDGLTAAAGTSLTPAREDHEHAHGDLSAAVTTHHDASQVAFDPGDVNDWNGAADPGEADDALDQLASRVIALEAAPLLPTGMIMPFADSTPPTGWVACDGSSLDSVADTTLADLFALIGTAYGGTGAADFNAPDLRGRVPMGSGTGDEALNYAVESFGVTNKINLEAGVGDVTNDFFPGRTFQTSGASNGANNGTFTVSSVEFVGGETVITTVEVSLVNEAASPATLDTADLSARTLAAEGGNEQHRLTTTELAAHDHDYENPSTTNVVEHQAGANVFLKAAATDQTSETGGDGHHNNIQPFLVLNYIIKK